MAVRAGEVRPETTLEVVESLQRQLKAPALALGKNAVPLSANVRDTAGIPLNSGGHTLARRIDGETRAETLGWPGAPGPGG